MLGLLLGLWGWLELRPDPAAWSDDLFRTVQLAVLQFSPDTATPIPWQLDAARFLVPGCTLLLACRWVARALRRPDPLAAAERARDHVIVVPGQGPAARAVLRDVQASHPDAVVVPPDGPLDPYAPDLWQRLGTRRAASVVVCRDDDTDTLNIVTTVAEALGGHGGQSGPAVIAALDNEAVAEQADVAIDSAARRAGLRYRRLSVAREAARPIFLDPPLPAGKPDRATPSHIVVAGLGPGAQAVLRHALTAGQDTAAAGPAITVLAAGRDLAAAPLLQPDAVPAYVATMRPLTRDPLAGVTDATLHALREEWPTPTLICVCLPDEPAALLGLSLARQIALAQWPDFTVAVHQSRQDRFLDLLAREKTAHGHARLRGFGGALPAGTVRALCMASNDRLARALYALECDTAHQFGEPGDPPAAWDNLTEARRYRTRAAADHVAVKLAAIGCRIVPDRTPLAVLTEDDIAALVRIEHRRWSAERLLAGWRLGERDKARRLHPDLVPFEELPAIRQERYDMLVRGIPALLAEVGMGFERPP